jgi:phenylacetate-CoA ligase
MEACAKELQHAIKTYVGVSTKVRVLAAGSVERTSTGKARRVFDKRPKVTHELPIGAI